MPCIIQEQISLNKIRLLVFFLVFGGCVHLVSPKSGDADGGKEIKSHPNAPKKSSWSAEDLKAKAEEYNQQAVSLFEEGRYTDAQELWEKAIGLMEHPRAQHPDLETPVEKQQSAESPEVPLTDEALEASPIAEKYQEGLSLLEQKNYVEAQKVFQEIDSVQPGYRNIKKYLIVIDELLSAENDDQIATDHEEYPEAIAVQETGSADIDRKFDSREEEVRWEAAVNESEKKLLDQIAERVEPVYQQALQQYKNKEYTEAKSSFDEVQVFSPDYKLTAKYLDGIDDDILYAQQQQEEAQRLAEDRARRQDELEFRKTIAEKEEAYRRESTDKAEQVYQQAIENFRDRKFEEAEDNFRKVDAMVPAYKLAGKYLERIQQARDDEVRLQAEENSRRQALVEHNEEEDMNRTIEDSERTHQQELRERAEIAYQGARTCYGQGELEEAKSGFREVERILPDYRSARKYLVLIEENMAREQGLKIGAPRDAEPVTLAGNEVKKNVVPASHKRLEAQQRYQQAKEFYKKREFVNAKKLFQQVNDLVRGYQATEKFLARIDGDIQQEKEYQQSLQQRMAQREDREKVLEQKKASAKKAAMTNRQAARGLKETAVRIKNDRNKMVNRKVQELYSEAESDYENRLYALARERFNEVERISPDYKSTEAYLERIAYEYQSEVVIRTTPPPQPVMAEVSPVPPPKESISPAEDFAASSSALDAEIVSAYDEGVSFLKRKQYLPAREKFLYVAQLYPDYKSASEYLARIDSLLRREQERQLQDQQRDFARSMRREKIIKERVRPMSVQQSAAKTPEPEPKEIVAAPNEASAKAERVKQKQEREAGRRIEKEKTAKQKQDAQSVRLEANAQKEREQAEKLQQRTESAKVKQQEKEKERETADRAAKEKAAKTASQKQLNAKKTEAKKRERLMTQVDKKYTQGLASYGKKDFINAKQKLAEVEVLCPNYKETVHYLSRVDEDILAQKQKPKEVAAAPIYVQPKGDAVEAQSRLKADKIFREAEKLYVSGQLVPAREKFLELEQARPGYKTTSKYLARIDRDLLQDQKKAERVKQKQEREAGRRIEKEKTAKQKQDAQSVRLEANAQKEREQAEKLQQRTESAKVKQQEKEKERETADRAAKEKAAKTASQKQLNAKKTEAKKRERLMTQVDKKYTQGLASYGKKDFINAKQKLAEVEVLCPNYKETVHYLSRVDEDILAQKQKPKEVAAAPIYVQPKGDAVEARSRLKADKIFREAVKLYVSGQLVPAREKFLELEQARPGYKTTSKYLARIDRDLLQEQKKAERVKQKQEREAARRIEKEKTAKQKQDAQSARLEVNAQKEREQAEKLQQRTENAKIKQQEKEQEAKQRENVRLEAKAQKVLLKEKIIRSKKQVQKKQQGKVTPMPAEVPELQDIKSVWVNPPDLDTIDLSGDVETLRRQYVQIQKERKNVRNAIHVRLDQTYNRAVQLYNLGQYGGAKDLFSEIFAIQSSFKGTRNFLAKIEQKLQQSSAAGVLPENTIAPPLIYVKPRAQVVADALDMLEAPH